MILELKDVHAYYGASHILHGIDLHVAEGETVALLGRNGAGKSTTMQTIVGLTKQTGQIKLKGQAIDTLAPWQRARAGVAYVPESRRIIPGLTVEENLRVANWGSQRSEPWNVERVYKHFPILKERRSQEGTTLSGGQQQMLTIARALLANPLLLLLDEPFQGLSPIMVKSIREIIVDLAKAGQTIILVEQNLPMALELANRAYVMTKGKVVHHGTTEEIAQNEDLLNRHLGV
jgi:branched-chain amino acid transport system ATP-binding protein